MFQIKAIAHSLWSASNDYTNSPYFVVNNIAVCMKIFQMIIVKCCWQQSYINGSYQEIRNFARMTALLIKSIKPFAVLKCSIPGKQPQSNESSGLQNAFYWKTMPCVSPKQLPRHWYCYWHHTQWQWSCFASLTLSLFCDNAMVRIEN